MRIWWSCWLVAAVFAALPCVPASSQGRRTATYQSGGRSIHVDIYAPRGVSRHAAILLLHGSGGMAGNVEWMLRYVRTLSNAGYAVYVPHYFDRTGAHVAADMSVMRRDFPLWLSAVGDGIAFASGDAGVQRIGFVGLSLGGYLATAAAARDHRVRAVVEMCGGLPDELKLDLRAAPPMLILHGARDKVVRVAAAYHLRDRLQRERRPYEIKVYPSQGHGFVGTDAEDARGRTLRFFQRWI